MEAVNVKQEEKKVEAEKKAPDAEAPKQPEAAPKPDAKASKKVEAEKKAPVEEVRVSVKSRVNLLAKDGTRMVVGKMCSLSSAEYARLKDDKRHQENPFWD